MFLFYVFASKILKKQFNGIICNVQQSINHLFKQQIDIRNDVFSILFDILFILVLRFLIFILYILEVIPRLLCLVNYFDHIFVWNFTM